MAKPTGITMPPASKLAACSSSDAVTVVIDRKDEHSMLCDPNHGGCANFRPLSSFKHVKIEGPFDKADSLLQAASDEERRQAAAKLKKHLGSPFPKPAALAVNPDRLCTHCNGDLFRKTPAAGTDLISCRSQHHDNSRLDPSGNKSSSSSSAAAASNFRLREPCIHGGHGKEHFRARRVPICNACIEVEIETGTHDRALYGKWDKPTTITTTTPVTSSSSSDDNNNTNTKDAKKKKTLSKGKARAAAKAQINNPSAADQQDRRPPPTRIDLSVAVLPLTYFPQSLNPPQAILRDHVRTDYFALSSQGKISWWVAAIERALQKAPGDNYLPEGEEMDKLLRILSGEEKAECGSCGEEKTLERGFAVRVYVSGAGGDKGVVLEAGDECLSCQWF